MIGIIMTFVSGLVLSFSLGNIVNQRHEKTEYLKQTFAHECFESELINWENTIIFKPNVYKTDWAL